MEGRHFKFLVPVIYLSISVLAHDIRRDPDETEYHQYTFGGGPVPDRFFFHSLAKQDSSSSNTNNYDNSEKPDTVFYGFIDLMDKTYPGVQPSEQHDSQNPYDFDFANNVPTQDSKYYPMSPEQIGVYTDNYGQHNVADDSDGNSASDQDLPQWASIPNANFEGQDENLKQNIYFNNHGHVPYYGTIGSDSPNKPARNNDPDQEKTDQLDRKETKDTDDSYWRQIIINEHVQRMIKDMGDTRDGNQQENGDEGDTAIKARYVTTNKDTADSDDDRFVLQKDQPELEKEIRAVWQIPDKHVAEEMVDSEKEDKEQQMPKQGALPDCTYVGEIQCAPGSSCSYNQCTAGLGGTFSRVLRSCPPGTAISFSCSREGTKKIYHPCSRISTQCLDAEGKEPSVTLATTTTRPAAIKPHQTSNNEGDEQLLLPPEAKQTLYPHLQTKTTQAEPAPTVNSRLENRLPIVPLSNRNPETTNKPPPPNDAIYFHPYGRIPKEVLYKISSGDYLQVQAPYNNLHIKNGDIFKEGYKTDKDLTADQAKVVMAEGQNPGIVQQFYTDDPDNKHDEDNKWVKNNPYGYQGKPAVTKGEPSWIKTTEAERPDVISTTKVPQQKISRECREAGQKFCVEDSDCHYIECINASPQLMTKIRRPCPPGTAIKRPCTLHSGAAWGDSGNPCALSTMSCGSVHKKEFSDIKEFYTRNTAPPPTTHPFAKYDQTNSGASGIKTTKAENVDVETYPTPTKTGGGKTNPNNGDHQVKIKTTTASKAASEEIESVEYPTPWYMRLLDRVVPLEGSWFNTHPHTQPQPAGSTYQHLAPHIRYPYNNLNVWGYPNSPLGGSIKSNDHPRLSSQSPETTKTSSTYVKKYDTGNTAKTRAPHIGYDGEIKDTPQDTQPKFSNKYDHEVKTTQKPVITSSKAYTLGPHYGKEPEQPRYTLYKIQSTTIPTLEMGTTTEEPFESANPNYYNSDNYYYAY